jgi:hypothetical protein
MTQLILKRAALSGEWKDDDYDVLADDAVVSHAAPVGAPWM